MASTIKILFLFFLNFLIIEKINKPAIRVNIIASKLGSSNKVAITNIANESMEQYEQYINLPVHDSPDECDNLLKMINETQVLEKIHNALQNNKPVLVHCFAGMQRSCALVACYLIKYYDFTPKIAIDFIKSKRPIAFFGKVNFMDTINKIYGY